MKPLEIVYWIRFGLGVIAALFCTGYGLATGTITNNLFDYTTLLNGISIALAIYLISYYAIKPRFLTQVTKPQKLITTGIGIYFLAWIVFWVMLYAVVAGPPPA